MHCFDANNVKVELELSSTDLLGVWVERALPMGGAGAGADPNDQHYWVNVRVNEPPEGAIGDAISMLFSARTLVELKERVFDRVQRNGVSVTIPSLDHLPPANTTPGKNLIRNFGEVGSARKMSGTTPLRSVAWGSGVGGGANGAAAPAGGGSTRKTPIGMQPTPSAAPRLGGRQVAVPTNTSPFLVPGSIRQPTPSLDSRATSACDTTHTDTSMLTWRARHLLALTRSSLPNSQPAHQARDLEVQHQGRKVSASTPIPSFGMQAAHAAAPPSGPASSHRGAAAEPQQPGLSQASDISEPTGHAAVADQSLAQLEPVQPEKKRCACRSGPPGVSLTLSAAVLQCLPI